MNVLRVVDRPPVFGGAVNRCAVGTAIAPWTDVLPQERGRLFPDDARPCKDCVGALARVLPLGHYETHSLA